MINTQNSSFYSYFPLLTHRCYLGSWGGYLWGSLRKLHSAPQEVLGGCASPMLRMGWLEGRLRGDLFAFLFCLFALNRPLFYIYKKLEVQRVHIYLGTHFSLLVTFYTNTLHLLQLMKEHGYIMTNQTMLSIYSSLICT